MTYVQVAGRPCAVCGERVRVAKDAAGCECGEIVHHACKDAHVHAATPEAQAPSTNVAAKKSRRKWPAVGVIVGISFAAAVNPTIRRWRWNSYVKDRAAAALGCTSDRVQVTQIGGILTARGCDDKVEYLMMCDTPGDDACLTKTSLTKREVNAGISRQLGL